MSYPDVSQLRALLKRKEVAIAALRALIATRAIEIRDATEFPEASQSASNMCVDRSVAAVNIRFLHQNKLTTGSGPAIALAAAQPRVKTRKQNAEI